jgi:hypothetical protein
LGWAVDAGRHFDTFIITLLNAVLQFLVELDLSWFRYGASFIVKFITFPSAGLNRTFIRDVLPVYRRKALIAVDFSQQV